MLICHPFTLLSLPLSAECHTLWSAPCPTRLWPCENQGQRGQRTWRLWRFSTSSKCSIFSQLDLFYAECLVLNSPPSPLKFVEIASHLSWVMNKNDHLWGDIASVKTFAASLHGSKHMWVFLGHGMPRLWWWWTAGCVSLIWTLKAHYIHDSWHL